MKNIVVFGGGDQAKMIRSICRSASSSSASKMDSFHIKYYVTHETSTRPDFLQFDVWLEKYSKEFNMGIVAIGDNFNRKMVVDQIKAFHKNFEFIKVIHPSAVIDSTVKIEVGAVVMAGVVINPDSQIGEHVVVNTGSIIEHDCILQHFSTAAPGCIMGGHVNVGENSFIGLGAKVIQQRVIGKNTVIGAGSVVTSDIPDGVLAYGNPCKVIRTRAPNEKYL